MTPVRLRQWLTLFLLTATASSEVHRTRYSSKKYDFVCTRVLQDGELEIRIQRGHVSAIETTVELATEEYTTESPDDFSTLSNIHQVLTLLQVTDGRHFIQLIYDSGWDLRDCEYIKSGKSVDEFYNYFATDTSCPQQTLNASIVRDDSFLLSKPDVTDYNSLRKQCKGLHKQIRQMAKHGDHPGLQRLKRDLFLYPGTNWCGSGSNARKFNELGYNAAADRCCRDHDHCPYTIEGFTRKFNFFNFRFHTISHCDCDESEKRTLLCGIYSNAFEDQFENLFLFQF
ncbi:uncharacterized protein [Parasteatoda tepidariorum]|uniref:uncharacterized protein isoform X2 n=1 Tax=Parasteatoda tepidariorum TaxID=114398 RepID=UPI0039BCBBB2